VHIKLPLCGSEIIPITEDWDALDYLPQTYSSCVVISDQTIDSLYGLSLQKKLKKLEIPLHQIIIPNGESSKTLAFATQCWNDMHRFGLDRQSLVIGFGGGVITDIAGFVAGCYMRGIDAVYIPTTLMGMVDAAIGGKNGVNLSSGKNLVGVIHHPRQILIGPHYLKTSSIRELRSGIAEVIKYGIVQDPQLLGYLEKNMVQILQLEIDSLRQIIQRSCAIKANIVEQDAKEHNIRSILNWGHTFAHAIETLTNYEKYLHGEAVSIGMNCAAHVSYTMGFTSQDFVDYQLLICQCAGLPTTMPDISLDDLIEQMSKDKKNTSAKISLIIAKEIGKVVRVNDVDKKLLKKALVSIASHRV
jgi:3-dehydroquinate synthase